MQNDFAISGRLEDGAVPFELVSQKVGINQIAVMRDRHLAAHAVHDKRLRVLDRARACRGVARMPDRTCALEFRQFFLAKDLGDESHIFVHQKGRARAIARHDACAFLAAMLQRKQTVVSQHRCIRMTEYTEKAALVLWNRRRVRRLIDIAVLAGEDHTR